MSEETLFSRIVSREIPADILYQDELVTAFRDINPQRPVHILIVPNHVIPTAADVVAADEPALGRLFSVAQQLAQEAGLSDDGYRMVINCKTHGRQEVPHLHMHLLGGADCGPMITAAD